MKTNILAAAAALSDQDLLKRIDALVGREREVSVELVAHLAVLELRPSLYVAQGYGSLFAYCAQALRLSEDVACNRIDAARVCRRFPEILELLASGSLTFSTVRMLKPHLTESNHETVLARAGNRTRQEIEALVAELAPRPDVAASVHKLPCPSKNNGDGVMPPTGSPGPTAPEVALPLLKSALPVAATTPASQTNASIVQALAPQRYRVQFTIGQEAHDQLRRLQALLCREIPSGDAGLIFERALVLLLEKVEKAKLGTEARERSKQGIRPGADKGPDRGLRPGRGHSRHIPNEVRRAVWRRDAGQCAFVSAGGQRCTERSFLELHHIRPYALDGPATVANISLRCRRHNQYEAELVFGPYVATRATPSAPAGMGRQSS